MELGQKFLPDEARLLILVDEWLFAMCCSMEFVYKFVYENLVLHTTQKMLYEQQDVGKALDKKLDGFWVPEGSYGKFLSQLEKYSVIESCKVLIKECLLTVIVL